MTGIKIKEFIDIVYLWDLLEVNKIILEKIKENKN